MDAYSAQLRSHRKRKRAREGEKSWRKQSVWRNVANNNLFFGEREREREKERKRERERDTLAMGKLELVNLAAGPVCVPGRPTLPKHHSPSSETETEAEREWRM